VKNNVKLTPWRVLNTAFLLGVGIAKATLTYRGYTTGPTTLDWILGIFWALTYTPKLWLNIWISNILLDRSYWLSILETEYPNICPWLFNDKAQLVKTLAIIPLVLLAMVGTILVLFFGESHHLILMTISKVHQ
jgi:hypothetical protein